MSALAEQDRQASLQSNPSASEVQEPRGSVVLDALSPGARRNEAPSEDQLLDVLYEVLAQGIAPRSSLTRELVERFLHEHARSRKPIGEMVAFFEKHGLPMKAEEYGADAELGELASGLQRERSSLVPGYAWAEPEEPATLPPATIEAIRRETEPPATPGDSEPTGEHATQREPAPVVAAAGPRAAPRWMGYAAAAVLLLALGAVFAFSQQRTSELEQRLDQARMQQRSTDLALSKLEQRAETLQGELKQSEQARSEQTSRLQDALSEQVKKRAAEEQAIERVLGPRYTKLRQKLADEPTGRPAQPAR